jgi:DNA polymerase-3 subunit delta'
MDASAVAELYPWLAEPWRVLNAHRDAGRVPQGLLIHGPAGVGKVRLAEAFAQKLLCARPGAFACGECGGCKLFLAGSHPDFIRVEPAEPGKAIVVDAVRHLRDELALKSQYAGYRVVVISPAHQMNISAANSLLKTLEEPAPGTAILLLTDRHAQLPATILSRCQRLPVPMPERAAAVRWLEAAKPGCDGEVLLAAAGGSPLNALALADSSVVERRRSVFADFLAVARGREEPAALAERWHGENVEEIVGWLLSFTADLVRLGCGGHGAPLANPDFQDDLQHLAGRLHLVSLCDHWSLLLQTRRALGTQANRQLLLEEALIRWSQLRQSTTASGQRHEHHR